MTLTETQQALAKNMGHEKIDPDNLVTLVRRRLVLEEVVISKEEFEKYNSEIGSYKGVYWSQLDWKDAQWHDYCEEETYYSAYQGDVTSYTDDIVAFMCPDPCIRSSFDPLEILNPDSYYDQFNK